ncbi:MAG TPA: DUF5686 and carboxypeptidase regulatory-like domain-containing protein [Bacteroidia bacterium]|nr:DUF5686 and carboxypeptidase regulatory-like domain-containing protein [Bacteroidia bacterium]
MRLLITAFFAFFIHHSFAALITGKVTGADGETLAFANVYIKGTTTGTTTNAEGNYRLELSAGDYIIVFRYIGYKTKEVPVKAGTEKQQLDIVLDPEHYELREVAIKATDEDPAYAIIRKAIAKRKYYLNQVQRYSCNVYIKGVQRIVKYPKKFLGQEVDFGDILDKKTGIFYLSESVSTYSFQRPDKVKEVMISSKVSGNNRAFSFNQASDLQFSPYDNIMEVGGISERGIISPIANNALFYYDYRLDGSYLENGIWVNKIAVIPKRKNDPVHRGYIYIQDSTWRVHSTDLYLTKQAQIQFVDTLRINLTYILADREDDIWMPGSMTLRFVFGVFGFEGSGDYVAVYSKYNVKPQFPKKQFKGGEVLKVNEDSNKRDSVYWEQIRPIPLTEIEQTDYIKRDSLREIRESEPYLDSIDHKSNKFVPGNLLSGYTYTNRFHKTSYTIGSPLEMIQFNTVEGWNGGLRFGFTKNYEEKKSIDAGARVRYGFSNEKVSGSGSVRYSYNRKRFAYVQLEGGQDLIQFNRSAPISPILNTGYTLFSEENYMKLFNNTFVTVESRTELVNGLRLTGSLQYENRKAVTNSTDYTVVDKAGRTYTSNNPLDPQNDAIWFADNKNLQLNLTARFRPGQRYINRPDFNYILGSKWPTFTIHYEKGIHDILESETDFDKLEAGINDELSFGMIGKLSYWVTAGDFINDKSVYFMDVKHFDGNKTAFSSFSSTHYDLLDYYSFSTTGLYTTVHLEHRFGGFIFNKIPGLRKLKLNEIAGFRYLYTEDLGEHYEFSFGIEKLNFIRLDVVTGFGTNMKPITGIVIGLNGIIN